MEHDNNYKMFTKINQKAFLCYATRQLNKVLCSVLMNLDTTLNNISGMKTGRTGTIKALS